MKNGSHDNTIDLAERFDYSPQGIEGRASTATKKDIASIAEALKEYIDLDVGHLIENGASDFESSQAGQNAKKSPGFHNIGEPEQLLRNLGLLGYYASPFTAAQLSLLCESPDGSIPSFLFEGPSGCGKSFLAKCLARITGARMVSIQCYAGMRIENLIEREAHRSEPEYKDAPTGLITEVFAASQEGPVLLLVDELDKADGSIDSFFLSPLQESKIVLSDGTEILANPKNLLVIFTKNFERKVDDALLRRVQPISMEYLDTSLERKILGEHCAPQLIQNLVAIADKMRSGDEAYPFERPPAPEEILRAGKSIARLLSWNIKDHAFIGKSAFYTLAKSANDQITLLGLIKYHSDFYDPLFPDPKKMSKKDAFTRMGAFLLKGIGEDPEEERRNTVYKPKQKTFLNPGTPEELAGELSKVGYQCLPYLAIQLSLLLNTPSDSVRTILLEGPSGCGKSFLAKCLSRIFAAEFMCLSCYQDMETKHLIEYPSTLALAKAQSSGSHNNNDLLTLGVLSRAFLKSQSQPTILLVDEIDKVESHIDTFFLGPLQDGRIWLESRPPIDANIDNLIVIFTKNNNRTLDQALLRRVGPISMKYLDATLERKILSKSCSPQLVSNLVSIADRMRRSDGTYQFERPPAPEELLTAGNYVTQLLEWGEQDFAHIGRAVWGLLAKSEHDRAVFEHMLRYHPDFEDPLIRDNKSAPLGEIEKRLGRWILQGIVDDPERDKREQAWAELGVN